MVRILIFILMVFLFQSCILDQKLIMQQSRNDSNELRLDGIYIHEDSLGMVDLYYLYADGTILSRGSCLKDSLNSKLDQLENSTSEKYKRMKFLWGRYMIDQRRIAFEKLATSDKPYRSFVRSGIVLNDTTFHIDQLSSAKGKWGIKVDEVYRFRKMHTKPDSMNKWTGLETMN